MTARQWAAVLVVGALGSVAVAVAGLVLWVVRLVDRLEGER